MESRVSAVRIDPEQLLSGEQTETVLQEAIKSANRRHSAVNPVELSDCQRSGAERISKG